MVKTLFKKIFSHKFESVIFFVFWACAFSMIIKYVRYNDDLIWMKNIEEMGAWNFFIKVCEGWQPRFSINALQLFFVQHLTLWKIVNSLCLTSSVFAIYKATTDDKTPKTHKLYIFLGICFAFWLIYFGVLNPAYSWLAGSPVYNIAFTAMIFSALPFVKLARGNVNSLTKASFFPLILATLVACYAEQTSVILTGFSVCMILLASFSKIKIPKRFYFFCAWIVLHSGFFNILNLFSPRHAAEGVFMPEFSMLSTVDKIFQAVTVTNYYVLHVSGFLFLACAALTAYVIYKKYNKSWVRFIGFLPLLYSLMGCIPFENLFSLGDLQAYSLPISETYFGHGIYTSANPGNFNFSYLDLLPAMMSLFTIVLFGFLIFFSLENIREKMIVSVLYALGLIVSYALGFTSALFGIGGRGYFIITMIMLLIFASQCRVAFKITEEKKIKTIGGGFLIFCLFFLIRTLILVWSGDQMWY